jgi:hypothetical protein
MGRMGSCPVASRRLGLRLGGTRFDLDIAEIPCIQAVPDDLEGQEVLPLLAQDPTEPFHVWLEELSVARRRTLGVN